MIVKRPKESTNRKGKQKNVDGRAAQRNQLEKGALENCGGDESIRKEGRRVRKPKRKREDGADAERG